jgi:peroxiredoxin
MKNFLLLSAFSALLLVNYSKAVSQVPQISFSDSTCIKFIVNNITDTLWVKTSFCSLFPFRSCKSKIINIVKPGAYYISYRMTKPEFVKFETGESFQSFLSPGDTMVLNLGSDGKIIKEPSFHLTYSGYIYNYYKAKKKKFGYYSFTDRDDNPVFKFFRKMDITREAFNEASTILKTSVEQNIQFIEENKKYLPNWFIDLEKANIIYGSADKGIQLFSMLKKEDQNEDLLNTVKFNNPEASISTIYYSFLWDYFNIKCPLDNLGSGVQRFINQFTMQRRLSDSLLSGKIKEYFIACRLSDLYYFSSSPEDVKLAESFIAKEYPQLPGEIIKFINYDKNQVIKFLNIKNDLPMGDKAPTFYLKDTNGSPFQISSFAGKSIYLHFWATWCEPCIKEIPAINKLHNKLNDKPIVIVNICLDDNPLRWKQIIERDNLKGINLICKGKWESSLRNRYFITELPHYTLVDKTGLVIKNCCNGPDEIYNQIFELANLK